MKNTKIINIQFFTKKELPDTIYNKIRELWRTSFTKNEDEDIELLDDTIVSILMYNNNIIGISFILCPSEKNINSTIETYSNIKQQGVTENDCYLYNVCIDSNYRRKGYAELLLHECHKYVSNKQKSILFVEKDNIPAIKLYIKLNYKVYLATPSGFIMEKNLY